MAHQVLFVCTGNTCRSPMAEALLRAALPDGSGWRVTSAGTDTINGFGASSYAIDALAEKGFDLKPHRSRLLTHELAGESAVIVAMTQHHAQQVGACFPGCRDRIHLMRSFDPAAPRQGDVCDPFGGTMADYRACCALLQKSIPGLLRFLDEQDKPPFRNTPL